jgi:topoisomerase IV subunit B
MMPDQLTDTVLNPDTRLLLPVKVTDDAETQRVFTLLMGKGEAGERRAWLEAKGDTAEVDI